MSPLIRTFPKINLCNSVEVLTNSFGTVISGRQV
ncbi:hypothetical protein [Escherichia coli]|nr:hypothetical protein [Escherichia coli]